MKQQDYKKYYGKENWAKNKRDPLPAAWEKPDPMTPWILLGCMVILVVVVWKWKNRKK